MLYGFCHVSDGMTHWQSRGSDDVTGLAAAAVDVEMTSYVLLATLNGVDQSRVSSALPIVRWLSAQRNSNGGFSSTQVYRRIYTSCLKKTVQNYFSRTLSNQISTNCENFWQKMAKVRALILFIQTLELYKSFTYLLTYKEDKPM